MQILSSVYLPKCRNLSLITYAFIRILCTFSYVSGRTCVTKVNPSSWPLTSSNKSVSNARGHMCNLWMLYCSQLRILRTLRYPRLYIKMFNIEDNVLATQCNDIYTSWFNYPVIFRYTIVWVALYVNILSVDTFLVTLLKIYIHLYLTFLRVSNYSHLGRNQMYSMRLPSTGFTLLL